MQGVVTGAGVIVANPVITVEVVTTVMQIVKLVTLKVRSRRRTSTNSVNKSKNNNISSKNGNNISSSNSITCMKIFKMHRLILITAALLVDHHNNVKHRYHKTAMKHCPLVQYDVARCTTPHAQRHVKVILVVVVLAVAQVATALFPPPLRQIQTQLHKFCVVRRW
uniref:Hemoglobin subunit beta n=1 Tax=Lygus hesperus TaxID=30085 RepID=A0A0A9Y750_LYGHE